MKKTILYFSLLLVVYFLTFKVMAPDYDLWARLAVGSLFFQTGGVLKHDIFSYSLKKDLWIDHEWGAGVIFYGLARCFGDWGLILFKFLLILAIFLLIIKTYRLYLKNDSINNVLYLVLIGYCLYPSVASSIRSQLFTFMFFVLWIYVLERVRRGNDKLLWILPVTMLFWANIHGGFVAGLGLLFIYTIGELLNGKAYLRYSIALVLSTLITLINPYGINYWKYIIEAATMQRIGFIEWQSISLAGPMHPIASNFHLHILLGFFIFLLLSFAVGIFNLVKQNKADWVKVLLLIITLYLGIKHQRHTVFFVLSVSGLLYAQYASFFASIAVYLRNNLEENILKYAAIVKNGVILLLIACSCIFIIPKLPTKLVVHPGVYPVGSLEFIKQNNLSGNLAITYNWGSYALWKLYPQCRVLIDGRYEEVYPNNMYLIALNFSEHLNENWSKFLDYFHTDIIVAPKRAYGLKDLKSLTGWQIVYEDMVSVVLLPRTHNADAYIYPNFSKQIYWKEDYSKPVNLK